MLAENKTARRWVYIALSIASLPILYFVTALLFALNYCDWAPKRFEILSFTLHYNDLEDIKNNPDSIDRHVLRSEGLKKRYDIDHYFVTTFYVRRNQISQAIEFSLWPFGIKSYYGYWHSPDDQ
jgi:hypothetical protein